MARILRIALTAVVALAGASAAAAQATAATPPAKSCLIGITAIEFKNTGLGFMDYADDACMGARR